MLEDNGILKAKFKLDGGYTIVILHKITSKTHIFV
jgi:hypothetical protein